MSSVSVERIKNFFGVTGRPIYIWNYYEAPKGFKQKNYRK
jgi:hypothetical protein